MNRKVHVGLAGISFPPFWGFEESQYQERIRRLEKTTSRLGLTLVPMRKTFQNADQAVAAANWLNEKSDLTILDVATFPEGKAAEAFFHNLASPVMLWARNETLHKSHIGHNSFCGVNFLAGNLALRGQRFRPLYGSPGSRDFVGTLKTAARLIGAARAVSGARIGLIGGGIVPRFHDIDIQAADRDKLAKRWDIRFVGAPTDEVLNLAKSYKDSCINDEVERFAGAFAKITAPKDAVREQARLLRAFRDISQRENFSAIAIRCWPELQTQHGIWPCPSLSFLNDEGMPAACEGDPGGALDMLLASQLAKGASTLLDIVDWDDKNNNFSIWHCGPTACSWADQSGAAFIPHNVDGRGLDGGPAPGLPGVVDMQFAPGPITLFRTLGALDDEFVVEGRLAKAPNRRICGSFGIVKEPSFHGKKVHVGAVRDEILKRALPHHYTAVRGWIF